MKPLFTRLITSMVYAAVLIAGMVLHPVLFLLVFAALLALSLLEFYRMAEKAGIFPQKIYGVAAGIVLFIVLAGYAGGYIPVIMIWAAALLLLIPFIAELYRNKDNSLVNIAATLTGMLYIALPIGLTSFLVFPGHLGIPGFYPWILTGVTVTIWVFDSVAYLVGITFGKHRLFERISPKKSWEGWIGGSIAAMVTGLLNALWIPSLEMLDWMIISGLVIVFGTFGDLTESMMKRSLNIKDSGNALPGHGGFLDRLDSFLFIVPPVVVWLCWTELN